MIGSGGTDQVLTEVSVLGGLVEQPFCAVTVIVPRLPCPKAVAVTLLVLPVETQPEGKVQL